MGICNLKFNSTILETLPSIENFLHIDFKQENGGVVLNKATVPDVYENKLLNLAEQILYYLGSSVQFTATCGLIFLLYPTPLSLGFGAIKIGYFLCGWGALSSAITLLYSAIVKYRYNKSFERATVEIYNRDIDHITKCFNYMAYASSINKDVDEISKDKMKRHVRQVLLLLNSRTPQVNSMIESVERRVEKALSDFSVFRDSKEVIPYNGGNNSLSSILRSANRDMGIMREYCYVEKNHLPPLLFDSWGAVIFQFSIFLFLLVGPIFCTNTIVFVSLSVIMFLISFGSHSHMGRIRNFYKNATKLDTVVQQNLVCKQMDFADIKKENHYSNISEDIYYQYLVDSRKRLYDAMGMCAKDMFFWESDIKTDGGNLVC